MTKRSGNWPYETLEEIERSMTEKDWRNTKTVVAVMVTVLLSAWFGFWMANGL